MSDASSKKIHDISKMFLDLVTEIQEFKDEIKFSQTRIGHLEAQLKSKHVMTSESFAEAKSFSFEKGSRQITQKSGNAIIGGCANRSSVFDSTSEENKKKRKYEGENDSCCKYF